MAVMNVRRGDTRAMNQTSLAVRPNVRFHASATGYQYAPRQKSELLRLIT